MPGNQPPSNTLSAPVIQPKGSNLVRSKSLRLSSSRPKPETATSTLTRHGSIRVPRTQPTSLSAAKPPFTAFRKPALKPKPSFCSSRSSDNFENNVLKSKSTADLEFKKPSASSFAATKHVEAKGNNSNCSDSHRTAQSDSPTHSDKSHSQDTNSWCATDLVSHLRRLTEEHEKLQVEHARLRMQLLESTSYVPVSNLRRDQQYLSQSDSHLASIPENSSDGTPADQSQTQAQEIVVQNYRNEILQLQEENRKLQRKYWEQVLNSELVDDESCNGASQQIVDLLNKLDYKEKELLDATGRVQELDNHLAGTNLELQQCHDALQDQQCMLDATLTQRDELSKQLSEYQRYLEEARETIDFMQIERTTLAETYQETEQSLQMAKAEMIREQNKSNELMDRARKLYAKVKDKNLQVQLLRAELDRTQGSCRDMLLSQGAELTMMSMHLSQMSMTAHSMLTAAADFAASELSLQKEMLEEVMADLDSENEKSDSSPKENGLLKSDSQIPNSMESSQLNSLSNDQYLDTHKSLPDIFSCEPVSPLHSSASSESDRPASLVQSMVRAFEQTAKSDPKSLKPLPLKPSEQNSDSVKSSIENLSSINGDLSHISSPSKDGSPVASSLFKPVGMATAFRPVRQMSVESDVPLVESVSLEEEKKTSIEAQLGQLDCLIKKVGKVIELAQGKFSEKIKALNEEKSKIQEEVQACKNKQYQLQSELNNRNYLVEKANGKTNDLLAQLEKVKTDFAEEKEALVQKNLSLTEEIKCLEAVNAEQSNQIKEEIKHMIEIAVASPNSEFLSNAQSICDKLNLKQEIAKLNAMVSQKEVVLQKLAQKFTRTTSSLEDNLKKAEKEIQVLDGVIEKVFTALKANSDLVEKHDALKNLLSLVSGDCTLSNINSNNDK